jgi:hypothetical protein
VRQRTEASSERRNRRWLLGAQLVLVGLSLARLRAHDGLGFDRLLAVVVLLATVFGAAHVGASLMDDRD